MDEKINHLDLVTESTFDTFRVFTSLVAFI